MVERSFLNEERIGNRLVLEVTYRIGPNISPPYNEVIGPAPIAGFHMNHAPIANAGQDQSVFENSTVTLDGSKSSDPDGETICYTWQQSDPTSNLVKLSDPSSPTPTFKAPTVSSDTNFTFNLTVRG